MSKDIPLSRPSSIESLSELQKLNERSRTIFRHIVETYLATGEPVGSRNLARALPMALSPASIRNVMSDLEHLGFIFAPHTSAGRLPTEMGLRMFVDGLLELGDLTDDERRQIEAQVGIKRQHSHGAGADRSRRDDLRPLALRRRRAHRQAGQQDQAHRVRAAGARQGPGGAGRRRPARREPRHRPAAGPHPVEPVGGRQLPQRARARPHARRSQGAHRDRSSPPPKPSSTR